ncbi:MAG: hypothetical protein WCK92_04110 [Bacteroidota bacterium]
MVQQQFSHVYLQGRGNALVFIRAGAIKALPLIQIQKETGPSLREKTLKPGFEPVNKTCKMFAKNQGSNLSGYSTPAQKCWLFVDVVKRWK